MSNSTSQNIQIAATGDPIMTRKISQSKDNNCLKLIEQLRDSDVSVTNLEINVHNFKGYPAAKGGGNPLCAPPWVLDELDWAGFDMLSVATNHVGDYLREGMLENIRELESRNWPYAGIGKNLAAARSPAYFESPAGRVALISACTTLPIGEEAGEQRKDFQGRPGTSPLHIENKYVLPDKEFEQIKQISNKLGLEDAKAHRGKPKHVDSDDVFHLLLIGGGRSGSGSVFKIERGQDFDIVQSVNNDDRRALLARIHEANRQADWVIVNLHSHEGAKGHRNHPSVPTFLKKFARQSIDKGADVFVSQGPHRLRGIEIYEGSPIFYSLGNFISQSETMLKAPQSLYELYNVNYDGTPADVWDERYIKDSGRDPSNPKNKRSRYESILPVCRFENGIVDSVELFPVDLGFDSPRPRRGIPTLATGNTANSILEDLQGMSDQFGTDIEIGDGKGIIAPSS